MCDAVPLTLFMSFTVISIIYMHLPAGGGNHAKFCVFLGYGPDELYALSQAILIIYP